MTLIRKPKNAFNQLSFHNLINKAPENRLYEL